MKKQFNFDLQALGFFTPENVPSQIAECSDYNTNLIEKGKSEAIPDFITENLPDGWTVCLLMECGDRWDSVVIGGASPILITDKGLPVRIAAVDYRRKQFNLHIPSEIVRAIAGRIDHYTISEAKRGLIAPNNIGAGKFTAKKLQAWGDYLSQEAEALEKAAVKLGGKLAEAKAEMAAIIAKCEANGGKVVYEREGGLNVSIDMRGVRIELRLDQESGYLHKAVPYVTADSILGLLSK
jgi:hypothetical protein